MKKILRISLLLLVGFCASETFAQNSIVDFSVFDMGFDVSPSQNFTVTSAVGQTLVDVLQEQNTRIEGGFIHNTLFSSVTVTVQSDVATVGRSVGVKVVLPPNVQTFAESLFFRKGGERSFTPVALQRTGDSLRATIPATAVTMRGVEYFIRTLSTQGVVRFPLSNADIIRVSVENQTSPLAFQRRMYKMVSVPVELSDPTILGVLSDDYGQYNPLLWRVFRWENERNVEHPQISARVTPGKAFWLITQSGNGFDMDNGKSVPTLSPVTLVLDTGWNQIASPFAFPVSWSSLPTSGELSTPYYYDGISPYIMNISVLQPWEGYFVENRSHQVVTLSVPAVEASSSVLKEAHPITATGERDCVVQLSASTEDNRLKDVHNYFGFKEHATAGDDSLDLHEPPPIGDYIQLSIVEGRSYLSNFKPLQGEGEQWELRLTSTLSDQNVIIHINKFGSLPQGFDVYVLDEDEFNRIPFQDGTFTVHVKEKQSVRSLRAILGTKKYAEEHSGGIPLVPIAYALEQNYPNPFNPSTTIRYQLSHRSAVALEVFNILGQRVRTLVNAEQVTGFYSVLWKGDNDYGIPVASGMYVYRLHAGEFVASRKLMLLR